jgi:hypothetical protein
MPLFARALSGVLRLFARAPEGVFRHTAIRLLALLLAGCMGDIGVPSGPGGAPGETIGDLPGASDDPTVFEAAPSALRKLTVLQYQNTVRDLLGSDVTLPQDLEGDSSLNGFYAIGAAKATVSPLAAEKFEAAAYALAAQALDASHRVNFVGCSPAGVTDNACTESVVNRFGGRAFRRPLTSEELARYVALAEQAQTTLGDFYEGLQYAVAGLLQSPHFLFRVELGEPDLANAKRAYDDHEMATRLAYMLWNSTPDDALLEAAARGELVTLDGLLAQADRLLASDRLKQALDDFHSERLALDILAATEKDPTVYSGFDDELRHAMRDDVLATIAELTFGADTDFRKLFDTPVAFVNGKLAAIYGLPPVTGTQRVELPSTANRAGLLGKAAFLASNAHGTVTSPTLRGKYVRERILCKSIPAPPPEVATVLPAPDPNAPTMRARLKVHSEIKSCAGCHDRMDPIGLSLEHFDTVGRYRDNDQGHELDTTGQLDGTAFDGALELSTLLRDDPRTSECVARQIYRYAVAHVETPGEEAAIVQLIANFQDNGYRFTSLLRAVVASDGFRYAAASAP